MVTPINNLARRLPEAGRIRTGVKGLKGQPMRIPNFRFTSSDEKAIEQIAALYGGSPEIWDAPGGDRFQVISEASEISVALPPDPLGGTPIYERWSGGGCERRCDGISCQIFERGPDGPEPTEVACLCEAEGEMSCVPKTRLSVILPEIRFGGLWRYESSGWSVAQEMPGFVEAIQEMQHRGITVAKLRLEERVSKRGGQTRRFQVPVLGLDASALQLASGLAGLGSISTSAAIAAVGPALQAASREALEGEEQAAEPVSDRTWERVKARCQEIGEDRCREIAADLSTPLRRGMSEGEAIAFLLETNNEPIEAEIIEEDY